MPGAILIVIAVVLVIPPLVLMLGGVLSVLFGWILRTTAEDDHAGSELLDTNY